MPEFFNVLPPEQALRALLERLTARTPAEAVPTAEALGRVTAEAVGAPEDLPAFPRSTVDGFSLRAADTFGASETAPVRLPVGPHSARVDTGDPLPAGTNAVVMIEHLHRRSDGAVEIMAAVAPWQHVRPLGEDIVATAKWCCRKAIFWAPWTWAPAQPPG